MACWYAWPAQIALYLCLTRKSAQRQTSSCCSFQISVISFDMEPSVVVAVVPVAQSKPVANVPTAQSNPVANVPAAQSKPVANVPAAQSKPVAKVAKRWTVDETRAFWDIFEPFHPFLSDPKKRNKDVWVEVAEKCAERGLENLDVERVENKWKSVKSRFLAVQDYNEGTGKDGPHKTFDYENEVGEILGERPNVRPSCIG